MEPSEKRTEIRTRAYSIAVFCELFSIGRTVVYEEIAAGRLQARKVGRRTLILADSAEAWLASLPELPPRHSPQTQ